MSVKSLGKESLIYGVGHVAARGVTFLLLPIYTNLFSLSDYGIISLVYTFLGFMNVILHYGLDASLLKHYVPADIEERKSILTNAYASFLLTTIVFLLFLVFFRSNISGLLFGNPLPSIALMVAGILFFDVLWSMHVLLLRAEGKPVFYTVVSFINVLLTLGLNILFVIYLKLGISGVLISNLITSGCIFFITFPIIIKRISITTLSVKQWKRMMKFGLPFLPAGIFSMILELSDRYILRYLTNIETVGLYNAGYKLGMLMMLVVMGFNMAWQPYFLKKEKNEREYIANVTTHVLSVLGFLWILILIWTDTLVKLQFGDSTFFGDQYWASTQIVSIIALAYIFHAIYLLQLPGVYLLERSGLIAWIRGLGAVSNIILNLLFIPEYGIVGAACATCISFILMAVFIFMVNRKLFAIKYEWKKILLITISAISIWISVHQLPLDNVGKIGFTILYPLIMFSMGILRFNKLKTLLN
tara:strand:- start:191 stop:1609 length:1419 start_codon:yes stop_codon:yes gene_type:complete